MGSMWWLIVIGLGNGAGRPWPPSCGPCGMGSTRISTGRRNGSFSKRIRVTKVGPVRKGEVPRIAGPRSVPP